MSKTTGYIITTLKNSVTKEYTGETHGSDYQAPYSLGGKSVDTLRNLGLPYWASPGSTKTPLETYAGRKSYPGAPPAPPDTVYYTEIINVTNSAGTTAMHIGSLYLDAQTYTTIGALANELKYAASGEVFVEFKRFTNGTSLTMLSGAGGSAYQYLTKSSVTVSTADWYDIYISASSGGGSDTTSSIRGVYYEI